MTRLRAALLPALIEPDSLKGNVVVVTDVLRATTTICMALANGAQSIHPAPSIQQARQIRDDLGAATVLGGERGGLIIDGFDQGNSPREYTQSIVAGRNVVLCTTNGTVAMESCRYAQRVLIGSFANLSATAAELVDADSVTIVCAGTDRQVTSEDVLFAGALLDRIQRPDDWLDDQAQLAIHHWIQAAGQIKRAEKSLYDFFTESKGGCGLLANQFAEDVQFCSQIDLVDQVPELDLSDWSIRFTNSGDR